MPARLTSPTVGLTPTRPLAAEGHTIEPSVSVPTPTVARLAATPAPVPELDPHGERSSTYGLRVCPPTPLHPLDERVERKLAHSLRLALPTTTAPAARSRATTNASAGAMHAGEGARAGRRRHPVGRADVALDQDRDAVERAADVPGRALAVEGVRDGERVGVERHDGMQRRARGVDGGDAREGRLGERPCRAAARGLRCLQVGDGRLDRVAGLRPGAGGGHEEGGEEGGGADEGAGHGPVAREPRR